MQKNIIVTGDGSHSISLPEMGVTYHSIHGAIQESMLVFIQEGFLKVSDALQASDTVHIFEMGLGTGLNALLTLIESEKSSRNIFYVSVDAFPVTIDEASQLNYCKILNRADLQPVFDRLHSSEWDKPIALTKDFAFKKSKINLSNFQGSEKFHLIYFDAFAPNAQPELWTKEIFDKMFSMLKSGGILVTYCSKGDVRRAIQAAGFKVEKLPGPQGKREMVRALKKVE